MTDLDEIKRRVDLRAFAANLLGRGQHNYSYDQYSCFMHEDRTPSLTIYNDHWYCYSCNQGGSILDFVMAYEKCDLKTAADKLDAQVTFTPPATKAPPASEKKPTIPMSVVQSNFQHIEKGLPYFEKRKIKTKTAYSKFLGVNPSFKSFYTLTTGERIEFTSERFAIPNIFDGKVRAINYRRNDSGFLHAFNLSPSRDQVIADLEKKLGYSPNELDILDFCGGDKYKQEYGSSWKPFNIDLVKRREGKGFVDVPQRYLLIHAEAKELDTLAVYDHGFPTVGVRLNNDISEVLPSLFAHIPMLYIIRDNDTAGLNKAIALQECLGRGRIISPPKDYKDSGEVAIDNRLYHWMNSLGLEPTLKEAL